MQSLKKYYKLQATPEDIYNALTNPVMLEIWTGETADFKEEEGSDFSLWDGSIVGKNITLEKNKLIEQFWYFDDVKSRVLIKLHPDKNYTSVELRHSDIPDEAFENIRDGWDDDYFGALEELFNE